jgi:hypothetical protein
MASKPKTYVQNVEQVKWYRAKNTYAFLATFFFGVFSYLKTAHLPTDLEGWVLAGLWAGAVATQAVVLVFFRKRVVLPPVFPSFKRR